MAKPAREGDAAQESQKGMVQRLTRLADVDVKAERIDIHLPDALLFDAGGREKLGGSIRPRMLPIVLVLRGLDKRDVQ